MFGVKASRGKSKEMSLPRMGAGTQCGMVNGGGLIPIVLPSVRSCKVGLPAESSCLPACLFLRGRQR